MVTAMALHRCLLIACVTLSQACDSKRAEPVAEKLPAPAAEIVVAPGEATDAMFEELRASSTEQVVLVIGDTRHPVHYTSRAFADGPGMVATLRANGNVELWSTTGREGTPAKPKLAAPLDEAGKNAIRAALADVKARTGAKRIDVIVDRAQLGGVLGALLEAVRPPFEDVRVVAGVPTTPSHMKLGVEDAGALQDTITAGTASLKQCFEESLRRDGPISSVRLVVEGTVAQGRFTNVSVGKSPSPHLGDCISTAVRGWSVTAAPGHYQFHIKMTAQ
jgi:hypothetical protein